MTEEKKEGQKCKRCQAEIKPEDAFCPICGLKQESAAEEATEEPKCSICGTVYTDGSKFCPKDGGAVTIGGKREESSFQPFPFMRTYPKAGVGARFIASLIDSFIILGLMLIPIAIFFFGFAMLEESNRYTGYGSSSSAGTAGIAVALFIVALIFYVAIMVYAYIKDGFGEGQSPGKKMMGIRVINVNTGMPCTKMESFLRALTSGFVASLLPILGIFIDPIMILASADGKKVGDKFANTQVINCEE